MKVRISLILIFRVPPAMLAPMGRAGEHGHSHGQLDAGDAWAANATSVLERAGRHRSVVRDKLIRLLAAQPCALTAQELEDALRDRYRDERPVARATVYRTLELLQEHQLINRLDVGDGVARYESADPGGAEHHHHLVCERCGELYPFDDPELERAIIGLSERHGLRVTDHEVTLRGICPGCGSDPGILKLPIAGPDS